MTVRNILFAAAFLCVTSVSYAQSGPRVFGTEQLMLDDNNPAHAHIFLTNSDGSLGIDNNGVPSADFPNPCALVDLSSTTKGFLLPRMNQLQESALCGGTPPEGMLVYNSTTHQLEMFNGATWVSAGGNGGGGGSATAWDINGNNNTNSESNFLGTTNAQDLVVRTNSAERLRILSSGNVGIGVQGPVSLLSVGTLSAFQVNGAGDLVSVKGVPYVWPAANASGVLTNDGSGNLSWAAAGGGSGWALTGNAGTSAGSNFAGTTDNQAFEIHVFETDNKGKGSQRVMRYEPKDSSANLIGGFQDNAVNGFFSVGNVIAGGGEAGASNTIDGAYCFIGGGMSNSVGGGDFTVRNSTITGGFGNRIQGTNTTIGGGLANIASSDYSFVGGGNGNAAYGQSAVVVGGGIDGESTGGNVASAGAAAVVGGVSNTASGPESFVGGGSSNTASFYFNGVVAGAVNNANGFASIIGGGISNTSNGQYSGVFGGNNNVANADNSVVVGGLSNSANATSSMVLGGEQAAANHYGQLAHASGSFANQGDAQTSVYVLRNEIGPQGQSPLFLDGGAAEIDVPFQSAYAFKGLLVGTNPGSTGSVAIKVEGLVRNSFGTLTLVGGGSTTTVAEDNPGGTTVTFQINGNILEFIVTNSNPAPFRYVLRLETTEVNFPGGVN